MTTARNRAINRIRRDRTPAAKTHPLEVAEDTMDETAFPDERLELIFNEGYAGRRELLAHL